MAQRGFCPVIRIKCSRKYKAGGGDPLLRAKSKRDRLAKKLALKKMRASIRAMRKAVGFGDGEAYRKGYDAINWGGEKVASAGAVKAVASAAGNPVQRCTITMGGKKWKVRGAAVGKKIASLIRTQKAGGCCHPKVVR